MDERRIIHEITPLNGKDVLYIADRRKKEFTYPIHNHEVFELNFVEHAQGVRRIVGDSSEVIGEYDLVLITSPDLEHVWEQYQCTSDDIREITVQFDFNMGEDSLFAKTPFHSMQKMMNEARKGLSFPVSAIMKVYGMLDTLSNIKEGFYAVMQFLTILYELSKCEGAKPLATSSFAKIAVEDDSRRILKVKNFISKNYMDELRLVGRHRRHESKCIQQVLQTTHRKKPHRLHHRHEVGGCIKDARRYGTKHLRNLLCMRLQQPKQFQPHLQEEKGMQSHRIPRELSKNPHHRIKDRRARNIPGSPIFS